MRKLILAANKPNGDAYNRQHGTRYPVITPRNANRAARGLSVDEIILIDPVVFSTELWQSILPCMATRRRYVP